jgi:N-methylhydantoinase A
MTPSMSSSRWRIGIDVGGTFTDFVAVPSGGGRCDLAGAVRHKTPSTPRDPAEAVRQGLGDLIAMGVAPSAVEVITHGTTIGLNAILQGRGAEVALLTSAGHRDVLQIGRARLPRSFDLHAGPPRAAVPRERVVEIDTRFTPGGAAVGGGSEESVLGRLREIAPQAIAVSLVGGYAAPAVEDALARRLTRDLGVPATSAATIWPQAGEYERTALAVLDAQIKPLMTGYLTRLSGVLRELGMDAPLYVTTSNGGSVALASAIERPIHTVLSGPAAGVSAAARLWPGLNSVTIDMGGTSSDIGVLAGGRPTLTTTAMVGDHPLVTPVVEVTAIGAGGGSVVWADDQAAQPVLRVGPRSAGAEPGPAAYGRGGDEPTLTDAYVQAGMIAPELFLGGALPLSAELASDALARAGQKLGEGTADGTAESALRIASVGMATRLRTVLARQGEVAERFTLVAFGGAGGTHAALLADEVGARRVIVPAAAATFCALGAAITPVRRDFVRTVARPIDAAVLNEHSAEMTAEALEWFGLQGAESAPTLTLSADLKYAGQPATLRIDLATGTAAPTVDAAATRAAFARAHQRYYGFTDPDAEVGAEALRLTVTGAEPELVVDSAGTGLQRTDTRRIRHGGSWHDAGVFTVAAGGSATVAGPAVIERADTSVLVPPAWSVSADAAGNLHLTREDSAGAVVA